MMQVRLKEKFEPFFYIFTLYAVWLHSKVDLGRALPFTIYTGGISYEFSTRRAAYLGKKLSNSHFTIKNYAMEDWYGERIIIAFKPLDMARLSAY